MLTRMRRWVASLNRSDYAKDGGQRVENPDAMAANGGFTSANSAMPVGGGMPPDYVKSYDEGRPPH